MPFSGNFLKPEIRIVEENLFFSFMVNESNVTETSMKNYSNMVITSKDVAHVPAESDDFSINNSGIGDSGSIDEIVYIKATAVLDNSQIRQMYSHPNNIKPLCEIIDSKDHIRRNVCRIKFGNVTTKNLGNSRFNHEMEVIFHVKTQNLWENARSYLRKHFGGSTWKLHDGTELCFLRIHQTSSPP